MKMRFQNFKCNFRNCRGRSWVRHWPNGLFVPQITSAQVHSGHHGLTNMVVPIPNQILLASTLNLVTRIFVEAEVQIDLPNQKPSEFDFVSCLTSKILHHIHMAMEQPSINSTDQMLHQGKSYSDSQISPIFSPNSPSSIT